MHKIYTVVKRIEETLITMFLSIMTLVIFFATLGRYTSLYSLVWAEELTRYLMICIAFIGTGLVADEGAHFGVDILEERLPTNSIKYLYIVQMIIVTCLCLFIPYYGSTLIRMQLHSGQTSPSLGLPMWLMYSVVAIGCIMTAIQNIVYKVLLIKEINKNKEQGGK